MHRKNVVFIQEGMKSPDRYGKAVETLDADFQVAPAAEIQSVLSWADLVIHPVTSMPASVLEVDDSNVDSDNAALLVVIDPSQLSTMRLPLRIKSDFILPNAPEEELVARMHRLLWPGEETSASDFITVGSMTVNLSTYQVAVNGNPIDFTYLEYALLAFLLTHPGHAYSRDALLRRVWGFEYYGGSRTVDVHVRRVRAKLGTELSARLETVRGVGYMWNM